MIESQTIAGPIAVARAFTLPPAADLPMPPPRPQHSAASPPAVAEVAPVPEAFPAPNPTAPFGPAPTFKVTYLQRVWEDLRWPGPVSEPRHAFVPVPAPRAEGDPGVDLRA